MQSIGSHHLKDVGQLGPRVSRTSGGLPRIIPKLDRELIRNRNISVIRFWMSLFSLYRVLEINSIVKLETITDPPKEFNLLAFKPIIEGFAKGFACELELSKFKFFPIYSASGTQLLEKCKPSTSFRGMINGILAIFSDYTLSSALSK